MFLTRNISYQSLTLFHLYALESIELLNFIERMRDKYLYVSDVEENDYEPDEEKRKKSRDMFRKR